MLDKLAALLARRDEHKRTEAIDADDESRRLIVELHNLLKTAEGADADPGDRALELMDQLVERGYDRQSVQDNVELYSQRLRLAAKVQAGPKLRKKAQQLERKFAEAQAAEGLRAQAARRELRQLETQANEAARESAAALAAQGDLAATSEIPQSAAEVTHRQREIEAEIAEAEKRLDAGGYRLETGQRIHLDGGNGCVGRLAEVIRQRIHRAERYGQPTDDLHRQLAAAKQAESDLRANVEKLRRDSARLSARSRKDCRANDPAMFRLVRPKPAISSASAKPPSAASEMFGREVPGFS